MRSATSDKLWQINVFWVLLPVNNISSKCCGQEESKGFLEHLYFFLSCENTVGKNYVMHFFSETLQIVFNRQDHTSVAMKNTWALTFLFSILILQSLFFFLLIFYCPTYFVTSMQNKSNLQAYHVCLSNSVSMYKSLRFTSH